MKLPEDEAAAYIIGRAAAIEPKAIFDPHRKGGHLGDLSVRYTSL